MNYIFYNGNILTQNPKLTNAEAIFIRKGIIKEVGSFEACINSSKSFQNEPIDNINLSGATLIPGFNDAHIHIWKVGNLLTYMLDLRGVNSFAEISHRINNFRKKYPDAQWIIARGFNEANLQEGKIPTKSDLDKMCADIPIYMIRTCAHVAVVNSIALKICGITAQTKIPNGGEMRLDEHGEPNGIFTETALGLITPNIPEYTTTQYRRMILTAQEALIKVGITAATDPAVMPDLLEVYKMMDKAGELKIRINAIPIMVPDGASEGLALPELYKSDFLKINTVKFFADGGLSGQTAALKKHYKNTKEQGVLRLNYDFFKPLAASAQAQGFKIATHAIGDAAIDLVIRVYKDIAKENIHKIQHRIEHLGLPSTKNLKDMQRLGIHAVIQSIFLKELGKNFRLYLGIPYLKKCYPIRKVLDMGINVSLSSDAPVVNDFNPLSGIISAVKRCDIEGIAIAPEQSINIKEALYAYTMGSAKANDDDSRWGSLEVGKLADLIILNQDISNINNISTSKVKAVMVNGSWLQYLNE